MLFTWNQIIIMSKYLFCEYRQSSFIPIRCFFYALVHPRVCLWSCPRKAAQSETSRPSPLCFEEKRESSGSVTRARLTKTSGAPEESIPQQLRQRRARLCVTLIQKKKKNSISASLRCHRALPVGPSTFRPPPPRRSHDPPALRREMQITEHFVHRSHNATLSHLLFQSNENAQKRTETHRNTARHFNSTEAWSLRAPPGSMRRNAPRDVWLHFHSAADSWGRRAAVNGL